MRKHPNLVGTTIGRLLVVERISGGKQLRYRCRCECGAERVSMSHNLRNGHVTSCGCRRREIAVKNKTTHNMSRTRIYGVWKSMLERCLRPAHHAYSMYGARGISVCERWHKFENFLADMGVRPDGMELDRINNSGPYSPKNCRWADRTTQIRNRRNTIRVTHQGVTQTLAEWAEALGVPYYTVQQRYHRLGRVHLTPREQASKR